MVENFEIEIGCFEMRVFWSEKDGGYIAVATDIPRHSAFGKTWPEAVIQLQSDITSKTGTASPPSDRLTAVLPDLL